MKKTIYFSLFLLVAVSLAFIRSDRPDTSDFNASFAQTLKNAKAYTLEVAEKMPAADYTFRPHDSVRTFGEQLAHICMSTQFLHSMFIKGE